MDRRRTAAFCAGLAFALTVPPLGQWGANVRLVDGADLNANAALGFAEFSLLFTLRDPFAIMVE